VHAVEGRGLGRVEVTAGQSRRIFGIVKPETHMERVRWSQSHVGVKTEDIAEKNRFALDVAVIQLLADFDIGLIPSRTEASREIGVLGAIGRETLSCVTPRTFATRARDGKLCCSLVCSPAEITPSVGD